MSNDYYYNILHYRLAFRVMVEVSVTSPKRDLFMETFRFLPLDLWLRKRTSKIIKNILVELPELCVTQFSTKFLLYERRILILPIGVSCTRAL